MCGTASSGMSRDLPGRGAYVRSCTNVPVALSALDMRVHVQPRFIGSRLAGS